MNVQVFQCHREGEKWTWPENEFTRIEYFIRKTYDKSKKTVAMVIDLSAQIIDNRVTSVLGDECTIFHLTIESPNRLFVKNKKICEILKTYDIIIPVPMTYKKIKERDEKIQSLVNEIEQNKKIWQTEKKTLLLQLEEKKSSDDDKEEQKEVPSKKENSVRDVTEKKKRWHFFNKEEKRSKEPDRFIETYLAGDTFNEAQKEFLIKCLEEGDTVEEMKTYASASLTPAMMQRLRQIRKKRRGQ